MTQLLNMFNQLFSESKPAAQQRTRHYDFDGAYGGM
jgi:hypothetical protein